MGNEKTLIVLIGPTAVGKTELSISIAEMLNSPIISADSRQMFRQIPIGTAAPTEAEQARVPHHFVGQLELTDYYSAALYEEQCMTLLTKLFKSHDTLLLTGGSMMYIDAVCRGIDVTPTVSDEVRSHLKQRLVSEGLDTLADELQQADPDYYNRIDRHDTKRIVHALELIRMTGRPYSTLHTGKAKQRPFRILKIGLQRPREELFCRINRRVDIMMESGFLREVENVYPFRTENSLNTVGYKEMFAFISGEWELPFAIERMKKNTRVYSKKQMTWFKRDPDIHWFNADDKPSILQFINDNIRTSTTAGVTCDTE